MDEFNRQWITERAIPIVRSYGGNITLRALHYRLVAAGMTNTMQHYKRVIGAMKKARWEGLVGFNAFVDHDREVIGSTDADETRYEEKVEEGKESIEFWMNYYKRNRWENQPIYPEVWIEKKALQSVFDGPCGRNRVALCPCKGYPSLTFLNDAYERFSLAVQHGKEPIMLYFGDYDPSGEDIPRSIGDTLEEMGVTVEVRRMALMERQVIEMGLPPAPTKSTDSRSGRWSGLGQVELDAIEPNQLKDMANAAIADVFDVSLHEELLEQQDEEKEAYKEAMKEFVQSL